MRIHAALVLSGLVAIAATVPLGNGAIAAPAATPSASPSSLPIGGVKVQVTQPGQTPTGATHVEKPPI
jgi:hypothetical protein